MNARLLNSASWIKRNYQNQISDLGMLGFAEKGGARGKVRWQERLGGSLLFGHFLLSAFAPIFLLALIIGASAVSATAQITPGGGGIFGADPTTFGTGLKEFLKWLRGIMFLVGVALFAWAGVAYYREGSFEKQVVGGVICWAYPTLAALSWAFSRGEAVTVDTDLGN